MVFLDCDYNNGCHPAILKRLAETNDKRSKTYGYDEWTESAKSKIRKACDDPEAQIRFLVGGTQTNATVIDSILQSYEGVIAAQTAHINTHEAGAIEFTEHKIITIAGHDGKIDPKELDRYMHEYLDDANSEHCVYPGMVYITFPTELGTLYTKDELKELYALCRKYNLPLYIDGARLGYGLMSPANDITLPYLARHCDVFYIGGTKVGALCGEAVVFTHNNAHPHFFNIVKQHGALMAKGRLIGLQFDTLFTDNLYFDISKHAIDMAMKVKKIFSAAGYPFLVDSPTNQQFPILPNNTLSHLSQTIQFETWGKVDDTHTACRFVTSWATTEEEIDELQKTVLK